MYLNVEKGNTNIDNQFNKNKFNFSKIDFSKMKLPLIISGVILLILIILLVVKLKGNTNYFISLEGPETISIYQNDEYVEPGYTGRDNKNNDLTSSITIDSNVDSSKIGTYQIVYKLKKTTKTRTVNVVEKGPAVTVLHLSGEINGMVVPVGTTYEEPGYTAIDSVDSDLTSSVKVTNNVDTSTPGVYRVIYSVTNSAGVTITKTRTVIVK